MGGTYIPERDMLEQEQGNSLLVAYKASVGLCLKKHMMLHLKLLQK